jgi:alkanesulfonate monooxygenase SsuD/methylene tetrahydromethanopterin reductase-like flavin-dependent oxidoreductase (luciferase family)
VIAMKKLWRDGTASFEGKFVNFPEVRCDPMSVSRPTPPVIIGAPGSPLTYRRAATWCDGWLPVMAPPEKVAEGRREITRVCEENGRDPSEVQITVFAMDATPATQRAYEDAGADRLVVGIWNHPGTYLPFEQWGPVRGEALRTPTPPAAETMRVLEQIHHLAQL